MHSYLKVSKEFRRDFEFYKYTVLYHSYHYAWSDRVMIVGTIVLNIISSVLAYDLNMAFIFNVKEIFLQTKKNGKTVWERNLK